MKTLSTVVAVLAIGTTFGQLDRSVRPQAGPAPAINIKNSETFKLSNGITVVLSENHKLPRVSFNLVMGGAPSVEDSKAGVNQLMGQLIMSGTQSKVKDDLDKEIDYMGATLTADGGSVYMSCLTKHLDKSLVLMQDVTMHPSFPESEFERIKKQAESSLKSTKTSPDEMAGNAERKINFPNHPNANVMNEQTLASITLEDIRKNYEQYFTPDGAYLVIVGDIDRATAQKKAEEYFAKWTGAKATVAKFPFQNTTKGNRVIFVNKPGAVQSVISVSFPVDLKPGATNQIPATVLNGIFGGGGFGTRLMQNLREDKAYTYGCYSDLSITREGSYLSASGSFRNEVTDSAITQLLYEFKRITEAEVSDEELSLTKSTMAGNFARSLESPQTIARFALNIIRNNLPADYYQNYLKRLSAVSKDDVLNMAQMYFSNGYNIVVVGNESVLEKLKQFDSDGVIEKLDAFGNPAKDMKATTVTAEDVLAGYVKKSTKTENADQLAKKMKKVKTVTQIIEFTNPQFPGALTATEIYVAPTSNYTVMTMGGMEVQKEFVTATKGASVQMGKRTEMTAEEIAIKQKTIGLFPEANYSKKGVTSKMLGIETIENKEYYVIETNDGETNSFDYYDVVTNLKYKSISIQTVEKETQEVTRVYGDYKEVNGYLFPHKISLSLPGMELEGTVKSIEFKKKVDMKVFN